MSPETIIPMSISRRADLITALIRAAAACYAVPPHLIIAKDRSNPTTVLARHAVWRALHLAGFHHQYIAAAFRRDRSTITHGLKQAQILIDSDDSTFGATMAALCTILLTTPA